MLHETTTTKINENSKKFSDNQFSQGDNISLTKKWGIAASAQTIIATVFSMEFFISHLIM